MAEEKKMKSSEALKIARDKIASPQTFRDRYVCYILADIEAKDTLVYKRLKDLFSIVGEPYSVSGWLLTYHPEYMQAFRDSDTKTYFQHYRLAWIDWMIPQYEAVGD